MQDMEEIDTTYMGNASFDDLVAKRTELEQEIEDHNAAIKTLKLEEETLQQTMNDMLSDPAAPIGGADKGPFKLFDDDLKLVQSANNIELQIKALDALKAYLQSGLSAIQPGSEYTKHLGDAVGRFQATVEAFQKQRGTETCQWVEWTEQQLKTVVAQTPGLGSVNKPTPGAPSSLMSERSVASQAADSPARVMDKRSEKVPDASTRPSTAQPAPT